eukprot:scpid70098/ scgid13664/ 
MAEKEPATPVQQKHSTRQSVQAPLIKPGRRNCIFCGSLSKKVPKSTCKQTTSQLQTEDAEAKLRRAAAIRKDERILVAISGTSSLIAREVFYHKYCYLNYVRETTLCKLVQESSSATSATVTDTSAAMEVSDQALEDSESGSLEYCNGLSQFVETIAVKLFDECNVLSA